ncbi:muscle M-line assembly protein unc-89-like isoform X1 [Vigna umbellata]|uniref:muscle M-line assembly protein unc-89-like isoform X1 n=2 Tax=Vigna umbellata TaxID=87088 RepID=UPI001F5ED91A|nr:muscle M-line assembly protein unc-89-like isoform X1 [Vigna umbellata]XP_047172052.1 muscle M-line assembly protein unc-89-like isoform X1 [Vigna umbellata]
MEDTIDATATLDYASIQIFPHQNRYEAFVCKGKQSGKVAAGHLEHLLPHLPAINDLYAEGFDAKFDLELPENLHGAEWFSKATLKRFLHVVSSPDLINVISSILDEMSQLEDSKKFHVSLYGKGHQDHLEMERDGNYSSYGEAPASKPEVSIVSPDVSKNELLRAMDLRLTALIDKLAETFNKATGATCSPEDLTYLAKFSQHFGATNIGHSLCKFIELNHKNQHVGPLSNETILHSCDVTKDNANKIVKSLQSSKPLHSNTPVKYGVSPAKAAQVERHGSTESEESSNSSDEDQTSAERSRSLVRSATPRRSASPMRRVQIGRAGPRRAAALTIKSLNYFPGRERPNTFRDASENDCEGEVSEQSYKKSEIDVRRITVQDAISLFESKQRDQTTDIQKRKSLSDVSVSTNKSVLRRWSAGMGETSVQDQPEHVPEDPVPVTSNDAVHDKIPKNLDVGVVSDFVSEIDSSNEITDCDKKPERQENVGLYTEDNPNETNPAVKDETVNKLAASAEWNQRKQEEFNQILKKMVESKPVLFGKSQPSRNHNISFERRGGSYNHYKEKRDEKLKGAKSGKVEKEAQFRQMQQLLDKSKVEMSKNASASKKGSSRLPQTSQRKSTQATNSPKETSKPSATKKISSRTSPMPATRKSWSATPSPRTAGTSPAKARGGISSANTTPTRRKPVSTTSVPQPSPQKERSQPRKRNDKETQTNNNSKSLRSMTEKRQPAVPNKSKAVKAKVTTASEEVSVPSKTSLSNKGTKKSSVVPLESKPFLRKGSRMGHGTADLIKKKGPPKIEKSQRESADLIEDRESELIVNASDLVSHHSDGDTMTPIHQNAATVPDPQINNQSQCSEPEKLDQNPTDGDVVTYTEESSLNIRNEEELTISPSAWVDTEEDSSKPCEDDTFQSVSLANAVPVGSSSPRVRHSLSQMLQEESSEPDSCEWGNAENPPAMIYQKDAPKGLKRLLKFARKSKGDTGSTGWSSPSVFSEGEDDAEELKNSNKRNADNLLRKAALNVKSYGQPKNSVHDGYERNLAGRGDGKDSHKMQDGAGPTRGSRSFFSLSAFRGSKP